MIAREPRNEKSRSIGIHAYILACYTAGNIFAFVKGLLIHLSIYIDYY